MPSQYKYKPTCSSFTFYSQVSVFETFTSEYWAEMCCGTSCFKCLVKFDNTPTFASLDGTRVFDWGLLAAGGFHKGT